MRGAVPFPPPRPGLPLLLPCALGMWACAASAYGLARTAEAAPLLVAVVVGIGIALAGITALVVAGLRNAPTVVVLILGLLVGCALGCGCGCAGALGAQAATASLIGVEGRMSCRLASDAKPGTYAITARAVACDDAGRTVAVNLQLESDCGLSLEDLTVGTVLNARLSFAAPAQSSAEYLWSQGICATAKASEVEALPPVGLGGAVTMLRNRAIGLIAEHGGAQAPLLAALVCGYRVPLEESGAYEDYKTVGLAHVVAVSGAHLAIVTATLGAALRLLRVPRKAVLATMALFALAYVAFAGVPVSAVRAAFMVLLMLAGQAVQRRSASLNALALCIIAFVAVEPSTAVSVSFFLSCASTLGIVLFAALFSWWFSCLPERLRKPVGEPLGLTLASNVATLPFSAALFSQVPLIAPLANVLATPLFSFGCVFGLGATLLGCLVPPSAPVLVGVASVTLWPLASVTAALADVPFACIAAALPIVPMIALSALACAVLWCAWSAISAQKMAVCASVVLLCTGAWLFALPRTSAPSLVMLDVGQGDSFLLRSGGHALLIDTGTQDAMLRESLGRNGVYALDAVLITHGDDDHCGSLEQLAALTRLERVLLAADALECSCDACTDLRRRAHDLVGEQNVIGLSVGDAIAVGAFDLRVLWPDGFVDEGGNADSLCVLASLDADRDGTVDWRAFLCGDAESEQLEQLVERGDLGKVDVLKVGHHGSRVALSADLLDVLRPSIALIGVGANNRYGHPTAETLALLEEAGAEVFRTDLDGDVALSFSAARISVAREVQ